MICMRCGKESIVLCGISTWPASLCPRCSAAVGSDWQRLLWCMKLFYARDSAKAEGRE